MTRIKHLIRGKSVREWSVYQGTLELHINGTPTDWPPKHLGLTVKQIQEKLGVSSCTVYQYVKDGTLERRLNGEVIQRHVTQPVIIDGMTTADCQAALGGLTRERVRQLKVKGLLRDRLNGVDTNLQGKQKQRERTEKRRQAIRDQRQPGESIKQLAKRIRKKYTAVALAFDERVPFAEERRVIEARRTIEESNRKDDNGIV